MHQMNMSYNLNLHVCVKYISIVVIIIIRELHGPSGLKNWDPYLKFPQKLPDETCHYQFK